MVEFKEDSFKIEVNDKVATVDYTEADAFFNGTDMSKAEIKRVFDYAHEYLESATVKATDMATDIMEKDSGVDKVVTHFPYGVSKRGSIDIIANRSQDFKSPADGSTVTKSTIKVAVSDPLTKMGKTKIRELSAKMTEALLK